MSNRYIQTKAEVEKFLKEFFPKVKVFGLIFLNRDKNIETLRILGMSTTTRKEIIDGIKAEDYIETIRDLASFGDMYVFGKDYDGHDLYIKISISSKNKSAICVSFHLAERKLIYPYK